MYVEENIILLSVFGRCTYMCIHVHVLPEADGDKNIWHADWFLDQEELFNSW